MQRAAQLSPGRPRDERIDSAVRVRVLELLVERGYRAVSINAVARAIGSSRATIYRRWRTSAAPLTTRDANELVELVLRAAAPTQSAAAGVRHRRRRREVRTN
jgi:AcrR family transcriptional regulator